MSRTISLCAAFAAALVATGSGANAQAVDPEARRIVLAMGKRLSEAKALRFRAHVSYDAGVEDQLVQFGGIADIALRRPDRLRVEFDGDERDSRLHLDGPAITLFDVRNNFYANAEGPEEIGAALDLIYERYGFSVPLADLLYPDPAEVLLEHVRSGFVVGQHQVDGIACHHLAFSQDRIDWQIWIEAGDNPLPRKLVITYKHEYGTPRYRARLSDWDLAPKLADATFRFDPPAGARPMEFLPRESLP